MRPSTRPSLRHLHTEQKAADALAVKPPEHFSVHELLALGWLARIAQASSSIPAPYSIGIFISRNGISLAGFENFNHRIRVIISGSAPVLGCGCESHGCSNTGHCARAGNFNHRHQLIISEIAPVRFSLLNAMMVLFSAYRSLKRGQRSSGLREVDEESIQPRRILLRGFPEVKDR